MTVLQIFLHFKLGNSDKGLNKTLMRNHKIVASVVM